MSPAKCKKDGLERTSIIVLDSVALVTVASQNRWFQWTFCPSTPLSRFEKNTQRLLAVIQIQLGQRTSRRQNLVRTSIPQSQRTGDEASDWTM